MDFGVRPAEAFFPKMLFNPFESSSTGRRWQVPAADSAGMERLSVTETR